MSTQLYDCVLILCRNFVYFYTEFNIKAYSIWLIYESIQNSCRKLAHSICLYIWGCSSDFDTRRRHRCSSCFSIDCYYYWVTCYIIIVLFIIITVYVRACIAAIVTWFSSDNWRSFHFAGTSSYMDDIWPQHP